MITISFLPLEDLNYDFSTGELLVFSVLAVAGFLAFKAFIRKITGNPEAKRIIKLKKSVAEAEQKLSNARDYLAEVEEELHAVAAELSAFYTPEEQKGKSGEKVVRRGLRMFLDSKEYKNQHNLIIETSNGITEIDHVCLSRFGIFVMETKHYSGWVFGSKRDSQWTQSFPDGSRFKFQNPLRQNYRHTRAISEVLAVPHRFVHSIVVFTGPAEIKTEMPPNVVRSPFLAANYIKTFNHIVFTDTQLWRFQNELAGLKQVSRSRHISNVRATS